MTATTQRGVSRDGEEPQDLHEGGEGGVEVLRDKRTSKASKAAAASALSQRAPKRGK